MSNPDTHTVIILHEDNDLQQLADYTVSFNEVVKTMKAGLADHPASKQLSELYDQLAVLSIASLEQVAPDRRTKRFRDMIVDLDEHLAEVGYTVAIDDDILTIKSKS